MSGIRTLPSSKTAVCDSPMLSEFGETCLNQVISFQLTLAGKANIKTLNA
jgi:hypothetical protein